MNNAYFTVYFNIHNLFHMVILDYQCPLINKKTLDRRVKTIMYNSVFKSALDYAAAAYQGKISKKQLNKIT